MKSVRYMIVLALLFSGCARYDIPTFESDTTLPNVTIAHLRDYYDGSRLTIADDIIISGRVISSDKAGNFYNTFFIDDGSGAVEIMAGMADLHATYHIGQRIIVKAKGLAVGWSNGVMQLGLPPEAGSGFATGYFYHPIVLRRFVSRDRNALKVEPILTDIPSLCEDMCGRLVTISGLRSDPSEVAQTWAETKPKPATGYRKFYTDGLLDSLTVITSGYAHFAANPLPLGEISATGIVLYGKGGSSKNQFLIKLRDESDIAF